MHLDHCYHGDNRDSMRRMLDEGRAGTIQTIITSPPYWGLRDYGVDGQIGLEPTLLKFLSNLVEVFDLCRQLLADDGTLWLNMGDSYAGSWGAQGRPQGPGQMTGRSVASARQIGASPRFGSGTGTRGAESGLKPKDLMGQPWRLAFALQDAGWYLRQDIIWHKPNPMPESVRDRCTKAHEYLFLLTKSERYYFGQDAISEPIAASSVERLSQNVDAQTGSDRANGGAKTNGTMKAVTRKSGNIARKPGTARGCPPETGSNVCGSIPWEGSKRNKRSVWTIPTESYSEAHFATFPQALVEPCILAGSRPGDVVFDPFMGSGTVAQVAQRLGRRWLGCELNESYIELQRDRTRQRGLMLETA